MKKPTGLVAGGLGIFLIWMALHLFSK